jgi:hypothetical protein
VALSHAEKLDKLKNAYSNTDNLPKFLLNFLPNAFRREFGIPWYLRLIYHWVLVLGLTRILVIIPRKHAKSTGITFGLVLYCILYKKKKYILIIGNILDTAMDFLERIRWYLENDKQVREVYGDLTLEFVGGDEEDEIEYLATGKQKKSKKWNNKKFRCSNGVTIGCVGSGKSMRGLIDLDNRPDAVFADDIEDKKNTNTPDLRRNTARWWYEVVMELGSEDCQYFLIGTIPHYDAFIVSLSKNPKWKVIFLRGMLTDTELEEVNKDIPDEFKFDPKESIMPEARPIYSEDGTDRIEYFYEGKLYPFVDRETGEPYRHVIWEDRYSVNYFMDKLEDARNTIQSGMSLESSFWQENFNIPTSVSDSVFNQFPVMDIEFVKSEYSY